MTKPYYALAMLCGTAAILVGLCGDFLGAGLFLFASLAWALSDLVTPRQ